MMFRKVQHALAAFHFHIKRQSRLEAVLPNNVKTQLLAIEPLGEHLVEDPKDRNRLLKGHLRVLPQTDGIEYLKAPAAPWR